MKLKDIVTVEKVEEIGFVCDCCDEEILLGNLRTDDFSIDYTCGYGTTTDGTRIVADICDKCIVDIIKKNVPKAQITQY